MFNRILSDVNLRTGGEGRTRTHPPARPVGAWFAVVTFAAASVVATVAAQEPVAPHDSSPHRIRFVEVGENVKLEVLDWGGSGRPVVLLAGLGGTAHDFDKFAPGLTNSNHVYGITRRGFGESSRPPTVNDNYSAARLGEDALAVCESLELNRPVLVGHSIAGQELSYVATRHPEKVAGVVYLDAAYSYAYYDPSRGDAWIDSLELRRKLELLIPGKGSQDMKQVADELLTGLPGFERTLREWRKYLQAMPPLPTSVEPVLTPGQAILEGQQKFAAIRVPALAIYAIPKNLGQAFENNATARRAAEAAQVAFDGAQATAFERAVPSARVVVIPHASHFVFRSNEADVLRLIRGFLATLDRSLR